MRWILAGAAAVLAAACTTVGADPSAAGAGGGSPGSATGSGPSGRRPVEQMVELVNAHRRSAGCPELVWMQAVANAAQGHSEDMARRNYFAHQSPEGIGPADRLRAEGVTYRAMGENIAQHPGTPRDVLAGWVASPGHRRNLEQCTYSHHGIGLRNGFWTHLFITPLPATPAPRP